MIDRIFWLHSKLTKHQQLRIVLSRENWEVNVDKSDLLNASNVYNKDDKTISLHVADFIATYKDRKVI